MADLDLSSLASGWAEFLGTATPWEPPRVTTMVVVPHPDDESLSTGGLIARLRRNLVDTVVVAVTDGDAAYPGEVDGDRLAAIRRREQEAALAELDVPVVSQHRLGYDDGGVAAREGELIGTLTELISRHGVVHVVAPWTGDHHPDHEAVGRAALAAARACDVTASFGLFWGLTLTPAPTAAEVVPRRLRLHPGEVETKRRAIASHVSQTTDSVVADPILHDADLEITRWPTEFFLVPVGA